MNLPKSDTSKVKYAVVAVGVISFLVFSFFALNSNKSLLKRIRLPFLNAGYRCDQCNVVIISIDVLRADALPCYGYRHNTSPGLCRFAEDKIVFGQAYSQSPFTLSSRMSTLTSLYPSDHKMQVLFADELDPSIITLPQLLHSNGYETIYAGPDNDPAIPIDKGIGRGFNLIVPNVYTEGWKGALKQFKQSVDSKKPTFLFLHSYNLHEPYLPNNKNLQFVTNNETFNIPTTQEEYALFDEDFLKMVIEDFGRRVKSSDTEESKKRNQSVYASLLNSKSLQEAKEVFDKLPGYEHYNYFSRRYNQRIDRNNEQQVAYLRALYDEKVVELDVELSHSLGFLKDNGYLKNTIIVITSDHGEEFMEHGKLFHGENVYNTSIHVPLIISAPGLRKVKIDTVVQLVDLFPTILGLLGLEKPHQLVGANLTGLMQKIGISTAHYAVSEFRNLRSVVFSDWKMIINTEVPPTIVELYNIASDPAEKNNVAEQNPMVIYSLSELLNNVLKTKIIQKKEGLFPAWIDAEKRARLMREGYF